MTAIRDRIVEANGIRIRATAYRHGIKACMHCASAVFAADALKRGFVACLTAWARRQLDDLKAATP